jgi:tripartite-type tricarboxylate transporter receptor subunit TctC
MRRPRNKNPFHPEETMMAFAGRSALALSASILFAVAAHAQGAYPSKQITLVVPYAAGGPSDSIARLVAESMGSTLGQTIVIENVAGAGGTTGAARVAKAEADGYTLLIHHLALRRARRFIPNLPTTLPRPSTASASSTAGRSC